MLRHAVSPDQRCARPQESRLIGSSPRRRALPAPRSGRHLFSRPCLRGADAASRRHAAPARQNFALWMVVDLWTNRLAEREVVLIGYDAVIVMTRLEIRPLHPSLGAEIIGVDLGKPVDVTTRQALSRALADHLALVFRDQTLTPVQYLAAASVF